MMALRACTRGPTRRPLAASWSQTAVLERQRSLSRLQIWCPAGCLQGRAGWGPPAPPAAASPWRCSRTGLPGDPGRARHAHAEGEHVAHGGRHLGRTSALWTLTQPHPGGPAPKASPRLRVRRPCGLTRGFAHEFLSYVRVGRVVSWTGCSWPAFLLLHLCSFGSIFVTSTSVCVCRFDACLCLNSCLCLLSLLFSQWSSPQSLLDSA